MAELPSLGILFVFGFSALVQLLSLIPLVFVQENRAQSMRQIFSQFVDTQGQQLPRRWQPASVKA
ncbi:MAG: hypothetical protein HC800_03590 [Phormidesmis sp. RL_2_1]|nr:hypothetical protein [Phormidesmis sp. RL_2_1]